jgi:hypothetical protein
MSSLICNICGSGTFTDYGASGNPKKVVRHNILCTNCGSLERTRLLWMFLEKFGNLGPDTRVLHLAPEEGLYRVLARRLDPDKYVVADIDPKRYLFAPNFRRMDLTKLEGEASFQYDIILHSHVMEHIPCNIAYTLYHLHRMLRVSGLHICVIPFMPGEWDETFADIDKEERQRRFGQYDHIRRFGNVDIAKHLGSLLKMPERFDATQDFHEEDLRQANVPEQFWRGFHFNTVLIFRRNDMKLLAGL